ncbi:FGGY-family carbohydrate kinase, partial [Robinsoniella peoriensis]|uniref:FGGY-family carbohydrate kinase n=1 Tax=Robinsoniella peoriensis TaxID=180332 RepID=UPI00362F710C
IKTPPLFDTYIISKIDGNIYFFSALTSAWIGGTSSVPFADEEKILFCFAHVIPGKYMPCGTMQAAGSAYSYVRSVICDGEDYDLLDERMKRSPAGAKGLIFLPYLLGERSPRWNSDTSGAYLGIHPEHKKDDYVRASMEGIAMNLELILKVYRRKMSVDTMILTGGGAKSPVNAGILADVMQVDFQVPDHVEEATSIGAAMIAGVGAGVFQSFDEVEKFLHIRQRYQADKEKENVYRFVKQRFELAYQGLLPFFKAHE